MKTQKMPGSPTPCWGILMVLLGHAGLAAAQTRDYVSESDFLMEMPIVLSVSRLPQRLDDTPGAVTILDRDMIRRSGARDVADLMRLVPGFQTSASSLSGVPLASYHGGFDHYSARMQVLVDGRSVYSTYLGGGTGPGLQTVALEDIDRIEVLRGSNSAAYGARAMLGVVNIVTRPTFDTLGLQAGLAGGENGIRDSQARIGWGGPDGAYRLTVDRRADNGLRDANGNLRIKRVNFRADLRSPANDEIQLRAGSVATDAGKGYLDFPLDPVRDHSFGSSYGQLDWRRALGEEQDLAFTISHQEESSRDQFALFVDLSGAISGLVGNVEVNFGGQAVNDTVALQHTFRQGRDLRVAWGGELRRERVISKPLYNTDAAFVTDFARLFGSAEWRFARDMVLNAGAMAEKSSVNGDSFAPRLMLNWHFAEGQTLRAGSSRAFRPPSTFEKFANARYALNGVVLQATTVARGNVQPESLYAHELGYFGDFPARSASLDVRVFHEQIGGFIRREAYALPPGTTLLPSTPFDLVNSEDFAIKGFEYQFKWKPWRDAQFIFNQAYIDINSADAGSALAAPKLASSITYFQKLPGGLDLSLTHQDSGTVVLQGAGYDDRVAMTRTDLRLARQLRFGRNRGELALVVQNLGAPYADLQKNFYFERRAFVTLQLEN